MPSTSYSRFRPLLLLLIAYSLATWQPGPGIWLRELKANATGLDGVRIQHAMLALMLLCTGMSSTFAGLRSTSRSSGRILAFTALSWLLPALAGILIAAALSWIPGIPIEVRLAVLIVSAMPVANSTAGWANQLGANIPLSLAVLVGATMLSPLVTAPIINLGIYATGLQRDGINALPAWGNDMSTFFALWVLIPIGLGVGVSLLLSENTLGRIRPYAAATSLAMLLLLNYVNGTVCLPGLVQEPGQFVEPLLAALLLLGLVVAIFASYKLVKSHRGQIASQTTTDGQPACLVGDRPADELSLLLAVVMRNTGAAMVYTSTALAAVPLVSLVVLFYTVIQHLFIGTVAGLPNSDAAVNSEE